jgi:hypothetical protein
VKREPTEAERLEAEAEGEDRELEEESELELQEYIDEALEDEGLGYG